MDLATVKTNVKAWERTFKAKCGRDPTKEDIRQDPSGIADQYALYRKLSKGGPTSASQPASSSSSTSASRTAAGVSQRTPRTVPVNDYPTTPTPPARRATSAVRPPTKFTLEPGPSRASGDSDRQLKRTASNAALNPPSSPEASTFTTGRALFTTPRKAKATGYTGPIYDPNPVNPFAVTPNKTPPVKQPLYVRNAGPNGSEASPFIHASSPRKFKEVLQLNSLKKVREREGKVSGGSGGSPLKPKDITPRTRARKRLRGEPVDDTPMKDKAPRRRRGEAQAGPPGRRGVNGHVGGRSKGKAAMKDEDDPGDDGGDLDGDDDFGPSPIKPLLNGQLRTFSELFEEQGPAPVSYHSRLGKGQTKEPNKPPPARPTHILAGRLGRIAREEKPLGQTQSKGMDSTASTTSGISQLDADRGAEIDIPALGSLNDQTSNPITVPDPVHGTLAHASDNEELPTPPADPEMEASASRPVPSRATRPIKTVSISDDEQDEWDPEGSRAVTRVVITGTRRPVRYQRDSLSSEDAKAAPSSDHEGGLDSPDGPEGTSPLVDNEGTTATSTHLSSPTSSLLAPPLLQILSLHSPSSSKQQSRLTDLRVKAIFNPTDARRLKAMRKGPDVYVSGEGNGVGEDDEEGLMERFGSGMGEGDGAGGAGQAGREGDDDWESEDEGWKKTGMGVDEEGGW